MSYTTYKLIHLVGVILLFFSLGGATLHALNGGDKENNRGRALLASFHGVALLLLLVAGFGALVKLGIKAPPLWVWGKLGIWLLLAAAPVLIRKKPDLAKVLFFLLPALGIAAALLALAKPGAVS